MTTYDPYVGPDPAVLAAQQQRLQGAVSNTAALITARPTEVPPNTPIRRWASVTAVNAGPPPTVNLLLGGTTVYSVRYLLQYMPVVGDTVIVDTVSADPLVIGRKALGTSSDNVTFPANVQVNGQLQVGANNLMLGDGWFRSYGATGWYSGSYGCGIFMSAADNYVRAYPDGVGRLYSAVEVRGGAAALTTWGGGYAQFAISGTGGSANYGFIHGGGLAAMSESTVSMRIANSAKFECTAGGQYPLGLPGLTGIAMVFTNTGSQQWGWNSSGRKFKVNIVDHSDGPNNPVWSFRVRRFHWNEKTVANGAEANALHPNGQVGLIADEVHEVAPHAAHRMMPSDVVDEFHPPHPNEGEIVALNEHAIIAHLVDAVQYLKRRIDVLEGAA